MKIIKKGISLFAMILLIMSSISSGVLAENGLNGGNGGGNGDGGGDDVVFEIARFQAKEVVVYDWEIDADVYKVGEDYNLAYTAERTPVEDYLSILIGVETNISFITSMKAQLITTDAALGLVLDPINPEVPVDDDDGSGSSDDSDKIGADHIVLCEHEVNFWSMDPETGYAEFLFECHHNEHFEEATHFNLIVEYESSRGNIQTLEMENDLRPVEIENHETRGYAQIQLDVEPKIIEEVEDETIISDNPFYNDLRDVWYQDVTLPDEGVPEDYPLMLVTLGPGENISIIGESTSRPVDKDNPVKDDSDMNPLEVYDYEVGFNVVGGSHVFRDVKKLPNLSDTHMTPGELTELVALEYIEKKDDYNVGPYVLATEGVVFMEEDSVTPETEVDISSIGLYKSKFVKADFGEYLLMDGQYKTLEEVGADPLIRVDGVDYYTLVEEKIYEDFNFVTTDEALKIKVPDGFELESEKIFHEEPSDIPTTHQEDSETYYMIIKTTDGSKPGITPANSDVFGINDILTITVDDESQDVEFVTGTDNEAGLEYLAISDVWLSQYDFMDKDGIAITSPMDFNNPKEDTVVYVDFKTDLPGGIIFDTLRFDSVFVSMTDAEKVAYYLDLDQAALDTFFVNVTDLEEKEAYIEYLDQLVALVAEKEAFQLPKLFNITAVADSSGATVEIVGGQNFTSDFDAYTGLDPEGRYPEFMVKVTSESGDFTETYRISILPEDVDATFDNIYFTNNVGDDVVVVPFKKFEREIYDYTFKFSDVNTDLNVTDVSEWANYTKVITHGSNVSVRTEVFSVIYENDSLKWTLTSNDDPRIKRTYTLRNSDGNESKSSKMITIDNFVLMKSSTKINFVHTDQLIAPSIEIYDVTDVTVNELESVVALDPIQSFDASDFKMNFGSGKRQQYLPEDGTEIFYYQMNMKGREQPDLLMGRQYMIAVLDEGEVFHFESGEAAVLNFTVGEDLLSSATKRDDTKKLNNRNK